MNERFMNGGTEYIEKKISEAISQGKRSAVISGSYYIDSAVRIPSHFTLVLENCHLRLADGCYSNIFVNENHGTEIGKKSVGADVDISVIGRGKAILDGGEYNGLSERNHMQNGLPPIWKNNLVLFTNVDGFTVSGLHLCNQRWWALNFVYCRNGKISDIDFCANDTAIDKEGNVYHGLNHSHYDEILVKNADGIDIRKGCSNITVENITGFTEDDSVAVTLLDWQLEKEFEVEGLSPDICDITVKNVATSAFCTNVRILNQCGSGKLHDIVVDGVFDTSENSRHMERGLYAVRIGDTSMYGARHTTCAETYNITVKNVYSAGKYAVALAGNIKSPSLIGIKCAQGTKIILDERCKNNIDKYGEGTAEFSADARV